MQEAKKLIVRYRNEQKQIKKKNCTYPGYYLVRESDGKRFFVSEVIFLAALEAVCEEVLSENDYQYWVDRSLGADVDGNPAWLNLDVSEWFFGFMLSDC